MSRIPNVPKERICELAKRIKPVVRFTSGLHYIKPVDLFTIAFTWDPKRASKAKGLRKLRDITTYHTYGYHGFFKPSIAEVLAQIPAELLGEAVAFETHGPDSVDDLNAHLEELNAGLHVACTTLYGRA